MRHDLSPLVMGLLAVAALVSVTTAIYRLLGLQVGAALYLACLTAAALGYVVSRRILRPPQEP